MKKLFGRRKKDGEAGQEQAAAAAPPPSAATVPPLPLQQLPELRLGSPAVSLGRSQSGAPTSRSLSGAPSGRSLGRSQSGMSSGRRSARRPREFIDLSQPEQVDAGSDGEGVGSAGLGQEEPGWAAQQGQHEAEEQQERDLALAWQLALGAQADQQPPPPLLAPHIQQQQPGAAGTSSQRAAAPSPLAAQPSFLLEAGQQAALAQQFHSLPVSQLAAQPLPLHESLPLPRRPQRRSFSRMEAAQEDVALAAALADLQFAAQQQEMAAKLAAQNEAAYQVVHSARSSCSRRSSPAARPLAVAAWPAAARAAHPCRPPPAPGGGSVRPACSGAVQLSRTQHACSPTVPGSLPLPLRSSCAQAAIEAAIEESMVTVNYDDLLRDIQLWVYDLDGAAGEPAHPACFPALHPSALLASSCGKWSITVTVQICYTAPTAVSLQAM